MFQYVKWTNDKSLGGIEGCLSKMRAADPNFGEHPTHYPQVSVGEAAPAGLWLLCPQTASTLEAL